MARPNSNEYAPYYHTYVGKVPEGTVNDLLLQTFEELQTFYSTIDESKGDFSYANGKWTIKQVLQHLIDTERVMQYRAMRIARNDQTPLPGFDQDDYAAVADVSHRTIADLVAEFGAVRQSSVHLFRSLTDADMLHIGTASGNPASARALAYIIIGHQVHHQLIVKERYF